MKDGTKRALRLLVFCAIFFILGVLQAKTSEQKACNTFIIEKYHDISLEDCIDQCIYISDKPVNYDGVVYDKNKVRPKNFNETKINYSWSLNKTEKEKK